MKLKKQRVLSRAVGVGICILMLWSLGCSSKRTWYKPGAGQLEFNIDDQDCKIIAQETARQATLTGDKLDPAVLEQSYEACIFSRGWTMTPAGTENSGKTEKEPIILAEIENNRVQAFGKTMDIPNMFSLVSNQLAGFQGVDMQTLFFKGDNEVYLNLIIQETRDRKFDPVDYPAGSPFFLFEKGIDPKDDEILRWTVFAGDYKGTWITGIGAYYLVDYFKRVSFVITQSISFPKNKPPKGLRLTKIQKLEVEAFKEEWIGKVKNAFGACQECL